MAPVQVVENPTVVIAPPPRRGARYLIEFRNAAPGARCRHQAAQALLWLVFLEDGRESGREVSDVICSVCAPARFSRAAAWAEALR